MRVLLRERGYAWQPGISCIERELTRGNIIVKYGAFHFLFAPLAKFPTIINGLTRKSSEEKVIAIETIVYREVT